MNLDFINNLSHTIGEHINKRIPEVYNNLCKENKRLEKENKDVFAKYGRVIYNLEKANETIANQRAIIEKLEAGTSIQSTPLFNRYEVDCRLFVDDNDRTASYDEVVSIYDTLFDVVKEEDANGDYVITNKTDIAILYMIMKESHDLSYKFKGTADDFAYYLQKNVLNRVDNIARHNKLSINKSTLVSTINKPEWKNSSVGMWKTASISGGPSSKKYQKAASIKKLIVEKIKKQLSFSA